MIYYSSAINYTSVDLNRSYGQPISNLSPVGAVEMELFFNIAELIASFNYTVHPGVNGDKDLLAL